MGDFGLCLYSHPESTYDTGIDADGRDTVLEGSAEINASTWKSSNSNVLSSSLLVCVNPDAADSDEVRLLAGMCKCTDILQFCT